MSSIFKYDNQKSLRHNLIDFANKYVIPAGFVVALVMWIGYVFITPLSTALDAKSLVKYAIGPVLTFLWLIHTSVYKATEAVQRIENKLDVTLVKPSEVLSLDNTGKKIIEIIKSLSSNEQVRVDFLGHNLTNFKELCDKIIFAAKDAQEINMRILMLNPSVDETLTPTNFYKVARQGDDSLRHIENMLSSLKGNAGKLMANIYVRAYKNYINSGGFRVYIQGRGVTYYFVAINGPQPDTKEHGWRNEYTEAITYNRDGADSLLQVSESLPSVNRQFALLFAGQFDNFYDDNNYSQPLVELKNYPKNDHFEKSV